MPIGILLWVLSSYVKTHFLKICGAPDKPCGVGRADANPKLLLNDIQKEGEP